MSNSGNQDVPVAKNTSFST